jgi:membrane fusion protein (multidrug efflux system)
MVVMLLAVAVFVAVLGAVKFKQIQTGMAMAASFQPPPEAVTTTIAESQEWPATLSAIGTVVAVHGVTVSADLPGIVAEITFESGRTVAAGDVLVRLDVRQERAQLAAAEAQRELTRLNFDRMQGLQKEGIVPAADYDRASAEFKQAEARVGEIKATIERKQIRAPFAGILGLRQVNLGQYLNGGDPVVPLQSLSPVYVNFSVPQQEVARVRAGGDVKVTAEDLGGVELAGKITALNSVIDQSTRNVEVQATLQNPRGQLRPGMFVQAHVAVGALRRVIALPASAISYAPYGDSVFVVADLDGQNGQKYKGVRQQFVKLSGSRGDQVAVAEGLEPGAEVVTSGAFKLRNGAAVSVHNEGAQPPNNPAPKPEDN